MNREVVELALRVLEECLDEVEEVTLTPSRFDKLGRQADALTRVSRHVFVDRNGEEHSVQFCLRESVEAGTWYLVVSVDDAVKIGVYTPLGVHLILTAPRLFLEVSCDVILTKQVLH